MNRIFLWTVLVAMAGSLISGLLQRVDPNRVLPFLVSQVMLVLPLSVYIYRYKINLKDILRIHKISMGNIALLILFTFFITPLMNLLNTISMLFATNIIDDTANRIIYGQPLAVSLFTIAIIPCILEESVYRGAFFNEYRKVNPMKGILLSAFLFGIMHMNLNQFVYAFAIGIIFALLVEGCDSILASALVHFLINASSVLTVYFLPLAEKAANGETGAAAELAKQTVYTTGELVQIIQADIFPVLLSTTVAVFLFINIVKIAGRWERIKTLFRRTGKKDPISSPYLWIGVGICVSLIIMNELPLFKV